jgi:hypothetical protein
MGHDQLAQILIGSTKKAQPMSDEVFSGQTTEVNPAKLRGHLKRWVL